MNVFILICFIMLLLFQIKIYKKNFFNLSTLFTLYWCLFCVIGYFLFFRIHNFSYNTFVWIFIASLLFFVSDLFTSFILGKNKKKTRVDKSINYNMNIIIFLIILGFLIRIIGCIAFLNVNNINILDFFSLKGITSNLETLRLIRYDLIPSVSPFALSIGNILGYLSILLLGFFCLKIKKSKKIIFLLFFASTLFYTFVSLGKSAIIFALILFMSAFFVALLQENFDKYQAKLDLKKVLFISVIGVLSFFLLMIFLIVIRGDQSEGVLITIRDYGFGEIPAFDFYFNNLVPDQLSFGKFTFYGVWRELGNFDPTLTQGVYKLTEVGGITTNVFTAFRSLIDDFGVIGSQLSFVLLGVTSAITRYFIQKNKYLSLAVPTASFIVAFILESYVISIGAFFSICASFALFVITLLLIPKISKLISYLNNRYRVLKKKRGFDE